MRKLSIAASIAAFACVASPALAFWGTKEPTDEQWKGYRECMAAARAAQRRIYPIQHVSPTDYQKGECATDYGIPCDQVGIMHGYKNRYCNK